MLWLQPLQGVQVRIRSEKAAIVSIRGTGHPGDSGQAYEASRSTARHRSQTYTSNEYSYQATTDDIVSGPTWLRAAKGVEKEE